MYQLLFWALHRQGKASNMVLILKVFTWKVNKQTLKWQEIFKWVQENVILLDITMTHWQISFTERRPNVHKNLQWMMVQGRLVSNSLVGQKVSRQIERGEILQATLKGNIPIHFCPALLVCVVIYKDWDINTEIFFLFLLTLFNSFPTINWFLPVSST